MATFKLIRPDKESIEPDQDRWFLWSIPIILAICGAAVWFDQVGVLLVLGGVALVLSFFGIPRTLLKDWPRKGDIIGEVRVDADGLRLLRTDEVDRIPFRDVTHAVLAHNHIMGRSLGGKDIAHNGIATLHMTLQNGQERTVKFLIESTDRVPDVEFLLRSMYKRGIALKEHAGRLRVKTLLFKHGRSYQEIQALKKELGL